MNNQYFFDNWYRQEKEQLMNPQEGLTKGNLFHNLYSEYKDYQPMIINFKTEQEKMLWDIQSLSFAAHELNLFLDTHPDNQSMIALFNDYTRKEKELTKEYENMYGPLCVDSIDNNENTFSWVEDKWPWEVDR